MSLSPSPPKSSSPRQHNNQNNKQKVILPPVIQQEINNNQNADNSTSNNNSNNILDAMSLSAWPSSRAGATPDFVLVLNHYLDEQVKRIDADLNPNTNFRAVARCEVLKNCCTAFEHHFTTYKDIFNKMSKSVDVLSQAFDQQHKISLEVDKWKQQVMKREETLRDQMKQIVEQHEREFATEMELKDIVKALEAKLNKTKTDLDDTYRAYVRSEESLKEANERNDELSRQHVLLTLRESRLREEALNLERQVDVSHNHAEC
jgi:hypothetical protein